VDDERLAAVVEAWQSLPEPIKTAIKTIIDTAKR